MDGPNGVSFDKVMPSQLAPVVGRSVPLLRIDSVCLFVCVDLSSSLADISI